MPWPRPAAPTRSCSHAWKSSVVRTVPPGFEPPPVLLLQAAAQSAITRDVASRETTGAEFILWLPQRGVRAGEQARESGRLAGATGM
jgi:hypothetical protein